MLIDTHTHLGEYGDWNCQLSELMALMDANHIDAAVAGWLGSNEIGAAGFENALQIIHGYEERLRLMLWINPAVTGDVKTAERMLDRYSHRIACMKVHPQTAHVPLGDPRYEPYLQLCKAYGLTLAVHTEPGCYSSIDSLAAMAARHTEINFVAVHMELCGDHSHAMELIARQPNLFGDTTFVSASDVRTAIDRCGADKIVFGSDAPIMGERYGAALAGIQAVLTAEEMQQVFHLNAVRLFQLGM